MEEKSILIGSDDMMRLVLRCVALLAPGRGETLDPGTGRDLIGAADNISSVSAKPSLDISQYVISHTY